MTVTNVQTTWMKEYSTDLANIQMIRNIFRGYIFRGRTAEGLGKVKCSQKQKAIIESFGIKLTLLN